MCLCRGHGDGTDTTLGLRNLNLVTAARFEHKQGLLLPFCPFLLAWALLSFRPSQSQSLGPLHPCPRAHLQVAQAWMWTRPPQVSPPAPRFRAALRSVTGPSSSPAHPDRPVLHPLPLHRPEAAASQPTHLTGAQPSR